MAPPRRRVRRRRRRRNNQAQAWGAFVGAAIVAYFVLYVVGPAFGIDVRNGTPSVGAEDSGAKSGSKPGKPKYTNVSQKILAEAKKYDSLENEPAAYVWAGGHPPKAYNKGDGLDCSGLVNVAVLRATGVNEDQVAQSFRRSKHWKPVSLREARAGDIMYDLKNKGPSRGKTDHVVFVVENKGNGKLTIFHAATSSGPAARQIRQDNGQRYDRFDGALRFVK